MYKNHILLINTFLHPKIAVTRAKSDFNLRRSQTGMRSTDLSLRLHIRFQSHNLPTSQHSRPKKQTRRHPRLHAKTKDQTQRTRNPRRRHPKQIIPIHKRLHRSMLLGLEKTRNQVEIYNIGSEDQTRVDRPTNRGKLSVGCNLANLKDAEAEG